MPQALHSRHAPSTIRLKEADGPPPRAGGEFSAAAVRLAGFAGVMFGWSPDTFWRATPAELAALVAVLTGGDATATPPDARTMQRLQEAFPDG